MDAESLDLIQEWYQLYLVPGGVHCGVNDLQPGVWPSANMDTMVAWVEGGVVPTALNASATEGYWSGETQELCQWPTRPLWSGNNSTTLDCVNDTASYESWIYEFPDLKVPVY